MGVYSYTREHGQENFIELVGIFVLVKMGTGEELVRGGLGVWYHLI